MKRYNYILTFLAWLLTAASGDIYAQTDTIRYVRTTGAYTNNGRSWETAKNSVQDAIDDLREYMRVNGLHGGSVYVAAGTYIPTKSTESGGGSMLNTSFMLYDGIHLYGGFNPDEPESRPGLRMMANGKVCEENWSDQTGVGTTSSEEIASQWDLRYKTVLDGNHSPSQVSFSFDNTRGRYNTAFPASSYHVVWFGTNGTYETSDAATAGHYKPLNYPALVDGCVITGGNASSQTTSGHDHTAYGGGVYMVGGACLRNCTVERCASTLRGGGVYLDGGGIVEFCYIHTCQSSGIGVVQGYGGGACIDYDGQIGHSHLTNCAARCGGGLAICHITGEYPLTETSNYSPFSSACVVNNNTASAEGGGVYLAEGGTINHATVTANNCISPDVTYYGRRHGRSGGIYVRDCGMIFNSVFWGNRCDANNDIQFASVRQVVRPEYQVFVYHCAFMNHDISDWTNVKKEVVFSLEKTNMPVEHSSGNFSCFFAPTVDPMDWESRPDSTVQGAGVMKNIEPDSIIKRFGPRIWHLTSYSGIDQKGVQVNDAVQDASPWLRHAHTDYGVVSNPYEPVSTLGALVRQPDPLSYALVVPQGMEGRQSSTPLPTVFIDPNREGTFVDGVFQRNETEGNSWKTPIRDIGEAVRFFRQYLEVDEGGNHHYMIPALDPVTGKPTGELTRYDYVQMLMKEGTISTVGPDNYLDRNIRTASVRIESHMRLYGGYPTSLEDMDTSVRDPQKYPSIITANITGVEGERGYENNAGHVIIMANVEHAIVDGFTLRDANTHNVYLSSTAQAGAGVLVNNVNTPQANRINMVGNQLRNCVIANCTAPKGAAVYVNGEYPKADGEICYAELMLVNCVVRNNKADYEETGSSVESHGVITANGRAYVHIEHCDIVNNVGWPFKADSKTTDSDEPIYCQHEEHNHESPFRGYIRVDNSIIFCNGNKVLDNRGDLGTTAEVLSVNADGQDYVFGQYNMFDADLRLHKADIHQPRGFFGDEFHVPNFEGFMPDGTDSHFTADISDIPASSSDRHNQAIFTRRLSTETTYPTFVNPARNVGNSPGGDKPLYGGKVSYTPTTTNPCVNAAYTDYYTDINNYDRSDTRTRDYGGAPDVGALETSDLPAAGTVLYVTPDGAGKRDGSSWDNAIAGNTVYAMNSGLSAHVAAQGDMLDEANGTTRLINATTGKPVLTTDNRYQGGFARAYITASTSGGTSVSNRSKIWTTEVNVYYDGEREGERDTLQNDKLSESEITTVTSAGSATPGFTAGWYDVSLYPYGEISGQSRALWRAEGNLSPMHENNVTGNGNNFSFNDDYTGAKTAVGMVTSGSLVIRNERYENYISGLQYAVEKASALNKTNHDTKVQVWVGAGKYTDYKGYVMRDSVSVYGGFPASVYAAPGLSERVALMADSSTVIVPKSADHAQLTARNYETILQISDVNPKKDSVTLNTDSVRFWDDNYSVANTEQTINYEYKNRSIVHHYHQVRESGSDIVRTYIQYPDFKNASNENITVSNSSNTTVNSVKYYTFGTATDGFDCWHLSHPVKTNYVANIETGDNVKNKTVNIYDPVTETQLTGTDATFTGHRLFVGNGSLTGLRVWQTIPNLPAGRYKLQIDMAGGYRNKFTDSAPTNMFFRIYDSDGNSCMVAANGQSATEVMLKSIGTVVPTDNSGTVRSAHFRYELEFVQANDGELKIQLEIEDGVRNTKAANSTYGTDTGGDPENIPSSYTSNYGGSNPNRREFFMNNLHLFKLSDDMVYVEYDTNDTLSDRDVPDKKTTDTVSQSVYTVTKHRTTLRKRVLTMPDVTNPVFVIGPGNPVNEGQNGGEVAHIERVIKPERKSWGTNSSRLYDDPNYKEYNEVYWNGFTIRHGFIYDHSSVHDGGAGVSMYEGAHLQNCIITDNFAGCTKQKGGGVFCNGSNATIEGCFILNNTTTQGSSTVSADNQRQEFAGGLFLYEGTCFNSLIANNYANGFGGLGLCVGRFYNNTVAYNRGNATAVSSGNGYPTGDVGKKVGGVRIATNAGTQLLMANTLIYGNNGLAVDITENTSDAAPFINCYVQSEDSILKTAFLGALGNSDEGVANAYGISNVVLNGVAPSAANTPFAADVVNGAYTAGARAANDFSLRQADGIRCVNAGTEDFVSAMTDAVTAYKRYSNHKASNDTEFMNAVAGVTLPQNDVVYADRVQDCQVDIGAYEYNAASDIRPDTLTHPGTAIYYVSFESPGGNASADHPQNAACKQKLQKVLDAAGRYKNSLMLLPRYSTVKDTAKAGKPDKSWMVEVWLEGDDMSSQTSDDYTAGEWYTPTRSTKHNEKNYHDNTLDYSFIVPHGVHLRGGYTGDFYHYEKDGAIVAEGTEGAHIVDERDPLTNRTVLSGRITSSTGAEGQCFHVVTFTNDLFTPEEDLYKGDDEEPIRGSLAYMSRLADSEKHRAVVDGLFIEDGYANSPDLEDRIGAGAVVTGYAHVRNCVVQNNVAMEYGGGLYLKPNALVSGTIIKKNTADVGGGMYVEAPAAQSTDSLAHIYTSTICENLARTTAGGMWFENTYARINSTVLWHNNANDYANISGNFSPTSGSEYPFSYSAVESRRIEGQANVELSARETEGVRWDRQDPFNALLYYPIEMSSTLARAGMTYTEWEKTRALYPTLDTIDIAGVHWAAWRVRGVERKFGWGTDTLVIKKNDFIEIGARVLNKTFEVSVDEKYVMHRLYVMNSDLLNSEAARALQDNILTNDTANMYRQMGSCILNPFHRLGDAFDYIINARKTNPEAYRNTVFEVYIEQGTYYPYHNAYGEQGQVRNNTFLVPEGIYVIGGINSRREDHHYGQEGYYDQFTGQWYGTEDNVDVRVKLPSGAATSYRIYSSSLDSIRLRDDNHRPMRDINQNSVIEPWELDRQTILSGNAVSGEDFTHVYHVITMHADSTYVGPQPLKFTKMNEEYDSNATEPQKGVPMFLKKDAIAMTDTANFAKEINLSILGRTTEFDGIQINGGYANHLDAGDTVNHRYVTKTYFRGGGIFVDGNWTKSYDSLDEQQPNVTQPAKYNIPIVVENCYFTNNMAGTGGALYSNGGIYMFGCHFTQNYSQGPVTQLDQRYIPWTAGGCIATNATCNISNTLFDNNEARRGLYRIDVTSEDSVPDADARQGFGGVISASQTSRLRVINCHFMRNKAVAYPSIYNFFANNHYHKTDSMNFAFNTIFWGNEVFEMDSVRSIGNLEHADDGPSDESIAAFNLKYRRSRAGVFHYDGTMWDRYEKLYHEYDSLYYVHFAAKDTFHVDVTNKLKELRQVGDSMEGLYFCSYRRGYGPTGMKPNQDGYLMTREEHRRYKDSRQTPVRIRRDENGDYVENYDSLFTYVHGNNNVLINRVNNAIDGPNFVQPTLVAGIDGYMQNADWLLARMNQTTDQGWGHLRQEVTREVSYYITKYTGTTHYDLASEALRAAQAINSEATAKDVYPVRGLPSATFLATEDAAHPEYMSMYNFLSRRYGAYMSHSNPPMPLRDDYYMAYSRGVNEDATSGNMLRISKNPKVGETDVYIDMGIYEYQYVQLNIKGQEIDTMWVATSEKSAGHDGLSWETPTTDLQTAIDILMSSHNNHDKYVCLLSKDGEAFSPTNVLDNRRAFVITSNSLSPLLPDSAEADKDYAVSSLTFLGGYKYDVKERDPYANPTVMEMPNDINRLQTNQLVVVENMTRQMLQANWRGESVAPDSIAIPITFDGITFINPYSTKDPESDLPVHSTGAMSKSGGAAIYYRLQRQYEREYGSDVYNPDFNMALRSDSTLIDGKVKEIPKLTISNCIFMNNGARTEIQEERSPAVRIEHGGGSSLIVNSLFHSNAGAPVYAPTYENVTGENNLALVPNNVMIVNSTFALNDGHITLESDSSQIHNSIIWQDDLGNDTTIQLVLNTHQWDKAANNTQPGIENLMTNNAVWGCFRAGDPTCHNDMLVTANNDVFDGPCFENPDVDATIPSEWQARSFRLNPSMKTMNMADTAVYRDHVFFRHYPDTAPGEKLYWRRANGFKTGAVYSLANDSDLASKPRLLGSGMERGAYECQAVLQRVLYVDPAVSAVQAGNGSSWEHAFGQGQLQNAVNVAAIYTYLNHNAGDIRSRRSYVFVKGSYDAQADEHIVPHDGVQLYGSIATGFLDTAYLNPETGYTDAECERYVNQVRATRAGVAAPNTATTRLSSVRTNEGAAPFATGFLLDGFVVSNPGETTDEAPLSMADPLIVVRNCVVTGNTRAAAGSAPRRLGADNDIEDDFLSGGSGNNPGDPGAPSDYTEPETDAVVRITGGLFYNNLVYDNTAPADIFVRGSRSLLLNNTVANANSGQRNLVVQHGSANSVVNCLFLNEADDAVAVSSDTEGALSNCNTLTGMFAPYMSDGNAYTLPAYLTQYRPLRYQLHERSRYIDAADTSRTALAALNGGFSSHIGYGVDFSRDLDVMANPRVTEGRIDLGCFETWRVPASRTAYATTLTNPLEGNSGREEAVQRAAYTTNYGGNRYPHGGSVVYLMENANLVLETDGAEPCFSETGENPFRPGYLLLEEGASLYGHGNDVQLSYVAACRRFSDQQYAMMAFPFRNHPDSVVSVAFDASADRLTQQLNPVPFSRFTYDGTARAAHNYRFAEELSSCWQPATAVPAATEGWLLRFDAAQDTLLRFTGWGAKAGQYVYTEDNSDYKTVTLTQYDHRTAGKNGSGLNFTRAEDMGWNLKGQPWLVGSFKTYEQENWLYTMNIPHLFYKMKADGDYDYADFSNDQIFTSRSWDSPSAVALGESFFTQTATLGASEPLRFLRPVKSSAPAPAPVRPLVMLKSAYGQADLLDVYPDAEADTVVTYRMGRDGIKWQTLAAVPQLWLSDSRLSTRLSLLGAAPVETDLQLGISIPARDSIADNASSGSLYTFSLPEPEAFAGYDYVWLIDRKLNRYVNLLDKEYGVVLPAGMDNSRFQLRIGGFPNVKDGKRQYVIFVHEGVLYVRGLVRGDRITLFGPDGRLVLSATAEDSEYQTPLHYQSGYVVRVNDYGQKVLNL